MMMKCSFESQNGLGLFVVRSFCRPKSPGRSGGYGMPVVAGCRFPFYPDHVSSCLVALYLFIYICKFQSFSDVRFSLGVGVGV